MSPIQTPVVLYGGPRNHPSIGSPIISENPTNIRQPKPPERIPGVWDECRLRIAEFFNRVSPTLSVRAVKPIGTTDLYSKIRSSEIPDGVQQERSNLPVITTEPEFYSLPFGLSFVKIS